MTKVAPSSISASRVAWALGLTAALLVAVDQGVGAFLDYAYGRSSESPVARIGMLAPRTLVLGSSTGKTAIDPEYFLPKSYNAAENGQSLFYVATILRNLRRIDGLERVVIAFDPGDFASGYRSNNLVHLWRVAPLGRHDVPTREWLALGDPWVKAKLMSGLFPYRGMADHVIKGWLRPRFDGNGFMKLYGQEREILFREIEQSPPVPIMPEAEEALASIVASARRLDVQLVAVVTPVVGGLRDMETRNSNAMSAIQSAFAENGHCDLTGGNAPDLRKFIRTVAYFWEGPHLNTDGAAVYSELLAETIKARCPDSRVRPKRTS